jgi:hypothetical protein
MHRCVSLFNRHMAYRWESCHMDRLVYRLLLDAALSGDGVLYCTWERGADGKAGDVRTVRWDTCELYAADMNRPDIQSQEYVILAGRERVRSLRREALEAGISSETVSRIRSDAAMSADAIGRSYPELEDEEQAKATVLLKFWKENGEVWLEKSTAEVVIRRVKTGLRLYPVAYFNWMPTHGSFHGTSPVSGMIANQRFINRAYAMVMKHMTDTAFSKVVYDKSRIPEWTNEVGEAIAAVGGDLGGAVQVVGVGEMQDGYADLIKSVIDNTKELTGATDIVLGEADPTNTSAIVALREAAEVPLDQVRASLTACIESLAMIWLEMMREYFPDARAYAMEEQSMSLALSALPMDAISAYVDSGASKRFSQSMLITTLQHLLAEGHITFAEYLERLPDGILTEKEKLLSRARGGITGEVGGMNA